MATTTITKPDLEAERGIDRVQRPHHRHAQPVGADKAAITTIDSDSMMVWFSPAMICGKA